MDILLDRQTHDIMPTGYDLPLVKGVDLIRQRLKQRLLLILGEWFLDTSIGLPWFQELSQKGISQSRVRSLLIRQINETEGVSELVEFELDFNSNSRSLLVQFRVVTPFGPANMSLTV